MPRHPDDQQIGIELFGTGVRERPGCAPLADRLHDRLEVAAGGREAVYEGAALGTGPALDDLGALERAHPVREDRARDPGRPRWSSLNPLAPPSISRTIRSVQRSPRISVDLATGQYCA